MNRFKNIWKVGRPRVSLVCLGSHNENLSCDWKPSTDLNKRHGAKQTEKAACPKDRHNWLWGGWSQWGILSPGLVQITFFRYLMSLCKINSTIALTPSKSDNKQWYVGTRSYFIKLAQNKAWFLIIHTMKRLMISYIHTSFLQLEEPNKKR